MKAKSPRKPKHSTAPKPDASYAIVAGALRSRGFEVNDNDYELLDLSSRKLTIADLRALHSACTEIPPSSLTQSCFPAPHLIAVLPSADTRNLMRTLVSIVECHTFVAILRK
jgi:hypothetical protein